MIALCSPMSLALKAHVFPLLLLHLLWGSLGHRSFLRRRLTLKAHEIPLLLLHLLWGSLGHRSSLRRRLMRTVGRCSRTTSSRGLLRWSWTSQRTVSQRWCSPHAILLLAQTAYHTVQGVPLAPKACSLSVTSTISLYDLTLTHFLA